MIGTLREWFSCIVAATVLLSVVRLLTPEGCIRAVVSFTGGLLLVIVLLRPVLGTRWGQLRLDFAEYSAEVNAVEQELTVQRDAEIRKRIEKETGAYILDKAAALGAEVSVRVTASDGTNGRIEPERVEVIGAYFPVLADWIDRELGIPAERQVWHEGKS